MRPAAALAALALVLATLAVGPPPASAQGSAAAEAPHPFYLQLLEEGVQDWQRGNPDLARETLGLATFGLLDHPPELVRGLAYLALAQAGTAGAGGEVPQEARDTLGRLIVVEDRFRVYAAADLPQGVRQALADLMVAQVPEATLIASPTFRPLGQRRFLERLAGLPPRERRAALAEQVARQPAEVRWQLALAAVELEMGEPAAAARRAVEVLATDPEPAYRAEARCVRGRALASTGACATAVADLLACPRSRTETATAADLVGCQAELGAWREAAATLDRLSPEVRSQRALERLDRKVRREVAKLPPAEPGTPAAAAATPAGPDTAASAEAPPPETVLPGPAREQLAEARRQMATATRAAELVEPLRLARQVADAHPGSREAQHLVGEIAYRASEWQQAVRYFRRGGEPERPEHRFYLAVSLFESGDAGAAAGVLEQALPELPRNPFVDSYVERILGAAS